MCTVKSTRNSYTKEKIKYYVTQFIKEHKYYLGKSNDS